MLTLLACFVYLPSFFNLIWFSLLLQKKQNTSVIRQKGESQNGCFKNKARHIFWKTIIEEKNEDKIPKTKKTKIKFQNTCARDSFLINLQA